MNISKEQFTAYLEGTLSLEQNQAIDDYLKENPAELLALKGAQTYQKEEGDFSELLDALNQSLSPYIDTEKILKNNDKPKTDKILSLGKYVAPIMAAAAAILLLVFTFGGSKKSYKSYLDQYPDIITTSIRGGLPTNELSVLEKGMSAYNKNEMQQAHDLYDRHLLNEPTDTKARFYRAITGLHLNQPEESLRELEIISKYGNIQQFKDGVEWYRAISLIALERYADASPILQDISSRSHYKRKEAKTLLLQIE